MPTDGADRDQDVIELLLAQHQRLRDLFDDLDHTSGDRPRPVTPCARSLTWCRGPFAASRPCAAPACSTRAACC